MIEGHSFRISRLEDSLLKFQLRIDNRTFDEVRLGRNKGSKLTITRDFTKKSDDPFADFQRFASNHSVKQNKSNAFGDFDFDSFSKPSTTSSSRTQQKPTSSTSNNNLLDFGFSQSSKAQNVPGSDFQTNISQTKSPNGFEDFLQSFKQNESNLLEDENQFSTNAYVNRNHYLDLHREKQSSDIDFGEEFGPQMEQSKSKTVKQNLMEYNKMASLATKKVAGTVAMKFNEMKKSISESLI